ncbi:hypothetical protein LAh9_1 [Aeromonas phage LAh_9]|uniref:Uncharacterized protein n=1 Tax=Aeromonas phage LAh_9 TaxID=2591033 RepID=A0A514A119_9CAUD|nr:hypothetical protein HWC32_gp001 [Aeromonas phage LAh_9]QDH46935.1 hypothetical protein LAh9_1 [Aeromonas phage LAh_9]
MAVDVPTDLTILNYPIKTEEAKRFWASKHKCNKAKAIMAFSKDLQNANWNLIQYGYTNSWRDKIFAHYSQYVNQPEMTSIPFTPINIPWWECLGYVEGSHIPQPGYGETTWVDSNNWTDTNEIAG